jgi:hypothetical protein
MTHPCGLVLQGWGLLFSYFIGKSGTHGKLSATLSNSEHLSTFTAVNIQYAETWRRNARQFLRNSERE